MERKAQITIRCHRMAKLTVAVGKKKQRGSSPLFYRQSQILLCWLDSCEGREACRIVKWTRMCYGKGREWTIAVTSINRATWLHATIPRGAFSFFICCKKSIIQPTLGNKSPWLTAIKTASMLVYVQNSLKTTGEKKYWVNKRSLELAMAFNILLPFCLLFLCSRLASLVSFN